MLFGKVLMENNCRDRVNIATKLPHWMTRSKQDMDKLLDKQLNKLKTDRIDYYLIHTLNKELWEKAKLMHVFQNGGVVTDKSSLASRCVQCEKCLEKCSQQLPIPDLLKVVQEDMEGFLTKPLLWISKRVLKVRRSSAGQSLFLSN